MLVYRPAIMCYPHYPEYSGSHEPLTVSRTENNMQHLSNAWRGTPAKLKLLNTQLCLGAKTGTRVSVQLNNKPFVYPDQTCLVYSQFCLGVCLQNYNLWNEFV